MQNLVSDPLARIWKKFQRKGFREGFVESHLTSNIAAQVATMRQDRSLTQTELAKRAKMRQSQISDIENPSFAGLTLKTLAKIAAAFDVAVIIRFVRFSDLARYALDDSPSKRSVTSFDSDSIAAPAPRPRTYFAQTATIVFDAHLVVDDGRGVTSIPPAHVIGANRTMKSYRAVN